MTGVQTCALPICTTYGGNPLACTAVSKVFDIYKEYGIVEKAKKTGEYLAEKLDVLKKKHSAIIDHRGLGMIRGLELSSDIPVSDVVTKARDKGLLVISAGNNVLRLVPPLVIEEKEIDKACDILDECIS